MVLGVIPARYASVRFPGKALARLDGKSLVQRVWEQAKKAKQLDQLVVATDDERIAKEVSSFGGEAIMTAPELVSGTDRVWEAAKGTQAEIIINIQGDEPLVQPEMIDALVRELKANPETEMVTLRYKMSGTEGLSNPNMVKVVTDQEGWAFYFSRAGIPFFRPDHQAAVTWYKHLGLYGYRRKLLEQFVRWPVLPLEAAEKLEQLRALERGVKIRVLDSKTDTVGVDTPEDLKRVEQILKDA